MPPGMKNTAKPISTAAGDAPMITGKLLNGMSKIEWSIINNPIPKTFQNKMKPKIYFQNELTTISTFFKSNLNFLENRFARKITFSLKKPKTKKHPL